MKRIVKEEVVYSERIAIRDDKGNGITYRKLAEKAELLEPCMEERSLVFLLCDKQMETLEFLYEILYLNRVPLLLASDMSLELADHLIDVYRPQYIYCRKGHELEKRYASIEKWENHRLLSTGFESYPLHPDLALLLSTSGTTGSAKLVKLSYENLYNNAEYAGLHLGICKGQKALSPLPVNYTYGSAFCFWHWHWGAELLTTEEPVISRKFHDFYAKERANNFAATPYTFQMLEKVRFWDSEKLSYLHFAMSGGAQMAEKDQLHLVSLMKEKFWIGYGQTECTCIISGMNFEEEHIKLGSIGKAFRNMEVTLDDKTGELCIQSKSVCMGYAEQKEDMEKGDVNRGFLHTGDVAYVDQEGCIFLKGRLARFVKILEKRVSLDDVEKYLKEKFEETDFACVGRDNRIMVFYANPEACFDKRVERLLALELKFPAQFISGKYIERIPRNDAGKVNYAELTERMNEEENLRYM